MKDHTEAEDDLRRYLDCSVRGLRGSQRTDVQAELRGHVEARCRDFLVLGCSPAEALRRTLYELGEPQQVSRGMARLYVLPSLARASVLSAALACAAVMGVLGLSRSLAQVQGYQPVYAVPGPPTYVDPQSLRGELLKAGVQVSGSLTRPVLTFPNLPAAVVVDTGSGELESYVQRKLVRDYSSNQVYLDANLLVKAVFQAGLTVRVSGWTNPQVQLGEALLKLGTPSQPVSAYNLLSLGLDPLVQQLGLRETVSRSWLASAISSTHRLIRAERQAQPGDVYALVTVMWQPDQRDLGRTPLVLAFDLARPSTDGSLTFKLPYDLFYLQLSAAPSDLLLDERQLRDPATRRTYASREQPAQALLLKLSGELSPKDGPYMVLGRTDLSVGQ